MKHGFKGDMRKEGCKHASRAQGQAQARLTLNVVE